MNNCTYVRSTVTAILYHVVTVQLPIATEGSLPYVKENVDSRISNRSISVSIVIRSPGISGLTINSSVNFGLRIKSGKVSSAIVEKKSPRSSTKTGLVSAAIETYTSSAAISITLEFHV